MLNIEEKLRLPVPKKWPQAQASIWINRAPEDVFRFISNYDNDPLWRRNVVKMTQTPPGEMGVGTTAYEEYDFLGRRYIATARVVAYEPDQRLEWASVEAALPLSGWRAVQPEGAGTRFSEVIRADLPGFSRWLAPLMVSLFQRRMRQEVAQLKAVLEGGQG